MASGFGDRISGLRKAKKLTLQELADRSQLGVGTLSRYEKMPNPEVLAYRSISRLADALEVDVRYLTGEDEALLTLEPSQAAARESLKRFLLENSISPKLRRCFTRVQDDPAAPKSVRAWEDLWRLLQQFIGRSGPKKSTENTGEEDARKPFRVLSGRSPKKPSGHEEAPALFSKCG
jgi:transcriptional regulator with XRE-family HTH domain